MSRAFGHGVRSWAWPLVVLLFVACGGDSDEGPDGGEADLGGQYLLIDSEGFTPEPGTSVRIHFNDEGFGFSAGCNSHFSDYEIEEGVLVIHGFSSTSIGCTSELHQQDEWLADFFSSRPALSLEGDQLTFSGDEATLTFLDREVAHPDLPLAGTSWRIDTITDGQVAIGGRGIEGTVTFEADSTFFLQGPCNSAAGSYEANDDTVIFGEVAFTEKACADPLAEDFEAHLQGVFTPGEATYEIDGNRLRLSRGELGIGAVGQSASR